MLFAKNASIANIGQASGAGALNAAIMAAIAALKAATVPPSPQAVFALSILKKIGINDNKKIKFINQFYTVFYICLNYQNNKKTQNQIPKSNIKIKYQN
jgi:hypothetical protein